MFNCLIPIPMTVSAFLICLLSALALGVLNALVFSFRSEHSGNLPFALVLVPPIVTLVIMMVNGNIGAGLGVAGAFSLIRFRSAPGTARELSGLFTGTAIGLACGMGYVGIAALFFLIVAAAVLVLTMIQFGEKSRSYRNLRILPHPHQGQRRLQGLHRRAALPQRQPQHHLRTRVRQGYAVI